MPIKVNYAPETELPPCEWIVEYLLELEVRNCGPAEFELDELVNMGDSELITGQQVYDDLIRRGLLPRCLSFSEGLAIIENGLEALFKRFLVKQHQYLFGKQRF